MELLFSFYRGQLFYLNVPHIQTLDLLICVIIAKNWPCVPLSHSPDIRVPSIIFQYQSRRNAETHQNSIGAYMLTICTSRFSWKSPVFRRCVPVSRRLVQKSKVVPVSDTYTRTRNCPHGAWKRRWEYQVLYCRPIYIIDNCTMYTNPAGRNWSLVVFYPTDKIKKCL